MRGSWRPNRTATYWPPTLMTITAFLSHSPGLLNWGPSLSGCWFSLPHLISNWLNFLCTELYNCLTPTFFLWASQIALIQPVHGQGYILIFLDRMHLLFAQVHFLFWQLGWGQYVTLWDVKLAWDSLNTIRQICLNNLEYGLGIHDFRPTWSLGFLQPEWNFLNHLLIIQWSTVASPFAQQIFLIASTA